MGTEIALLVSWSGCYTRTFCARTGKWMLKTRPLICLWNLMPSSLLLVSTMPRIDKKPLKNKQTAPRIGCVRTQNSELINGSLNIHHLIIIIFNFFSIHCICSVDLLLKSSCYCCSMSALLLRKCEGFQWTTVQMRNVTRKVVSLK